MKTGLKPNYKILYQSAIFGLQDAYSRYKREMIRSIESTFIGDNGEFFVLSESEECQADMDKLIEEITLLKLQVNEIKKQMEVENNAEN